MANLINTLYPPAIHTFMPAFVKDTPVRIYFSLSPFNERQKIKRAHLSLVKQSTNENALVNPNGILFFDLSFDDNNNMYYIDLPTDKSVIKNGINNNQYYQAQIRFDGSENNIPALPVMPPAGDQQEALEKYYKNQYLYLTANAENFSEWSTICLIRAISQPQIVLRNFEFSEEAIPGFNKGIIPISGKMVFADPKEKEKLASYKFEVLPLDSDAVLLSTPMIFTSNQIDPNDINYRLDLQGLETNTNTDFRLRITVQTRNEYTESKIYTFQIIDFLEDEWFKPTITPVVDNENGIVTVQIKNANTVFGFVRIKRSSSLSSFKDWELISEEKVAGPIDMTIKDNTVGSLVWYKYSVQLENLKGTSTPVFYSNKIILDFYDAILSRGDKQLKIKYNYQVSNIKPVVNRTKIDTLGGKYPRFAENAMMNYKQFSISGILTAMTDMEETFLNRQEYFGEDYDNYINYSTPDSYINEIVDEQGKIIERKTCYKDTVYRKDSNDKFIGVEAYNHNDFFWEREFREAALAWLNDGEPKLYRSMAEGSMVVMLTDVSIAPNAQVGRRFANFSATVYEVGEASSLEELDNLFIYKVNKLSETDFKKPLPEEQKTENLQKIGQKIFAANMVNNEQMNQGIVSNYIYPELKSQYQGVLKAKIPPIEDVYLTDVKIQFLDTPNSSGEEPLGYKFLITPVGEINPLEVFVNMDGKYAPPSGVKIKEIQMAPCGVIINYVLNYKEQNTESSIIAGNSIEKKVVGQVKGSFLPLESISKKIKNKYNFISPDNYYQRMIFWKGLMLEVDPYTMIKLTYTDSDKENKILNFDYTVGFTGIFDLFEDVKVEDLKILGRRLEKVDNSIACRSWQYHIDKSFDELAPLEESQQAIWSGDDVSLGEQVKILFTDSWGNIENEPDIAANWSKITETINQIVDIKNPQYNTIYKIEGQPVIYYHNGQWYPVEFVDENKTECIAMVPVEGYINYYGDVIRTDY